MSHPHNRDWPDDYLPTPVEIHMNFARMLIDEIDPDWVFMNTLDFLDALATHGIVLAPDFKGTANYGYLAAVAPGQEVMHPTCKECGKYIFAVDGCKGHKND